MNAQHEETAWVCVAVIATAHGVRGALKLRCFTEQPEDVVAYGPVFDRQGRRLFSLTVIGDAKGGVIAKAEGIDDRSAAEALRGTELFVPRSALPELDDEEFYYRDLEGLTALDSDGGRIGVVKQIVNYGAGELIEIKADDGEIFLLPFDKATVPTIDLDQGHLVVTPRPELIGEAGT
ncbi:MAG: ribosome maturation factor RimM [Geminicoccaceae bacterium]